MCDKTMENYKPNMFQLQCLKALEKMCIRDSSDADQRKD